MDCRFIENSEPLRSKQSSQKSSIATNCPSISKSPSNQTGSTTPSIALSSNLLIQMLDNHQPSRFTSRIKLVFI
ncbi:hypothetical protein PGTUg99_001114 [Puccinia graminis f. sp. tritici]|uniref:Uncharacterized protein n=1 Tax=Puccinia graminis f. sp. tritici TaxID=56615 RepID=A0A5B0M430_PUCGR|nr:hypothetical protein PGTUg99_015587 [Puccinia graminis f. sp. tritici]KAA1090361.1 hypothetical protein PGTUg99_000485 [Puccinia graminis f. sp. tritici]KAA1112118.1 hypothetical protein PGTUg99_001114 [Puccinia graminis f. sp. tritici]